MSPSRSPSAARLPPGERWRLGLAVVALFLLQGFLLFGYRFFEARVDDAAASFVPPLINEVTGAVGGLLLFPLVYLLCARFRPGHSGWWRTLAAHAAALPAYSGVHTLMNWLFRTALYPVFGVPGGYGDLRLRLAQEFFNDVWGYAIMIVIVYGFLYYRDTKARELETSRLQTELGRAKLRDLQARLHPHFLFNTLNAIAAHVGDDPAGAERMIERLSRLLRRSLSASENQETSVSEEIETLELYLEVMTERLGDRLSTAIRLAPGTPDAVLPTFLLQPLVENAITHGIAPRARGGEVSIGIDRDGDTLEVVVDDDGVGLRGTPRDALRLGIGLSSTIERLRRLYGERGVLEIAPLEGGTRVRVRIPWRRLDGVEP